MKVLKILQHLTDTALNYFHTKWKVKFDGSCLKKDKPTFTHKQILTSCL